MTFGKRQNYKDKEQTSGCQTLGVEGVFNTKRVGGGERNLGCDKNVNVLFLECGGGYITTLLRTHGIVHHRVHSTLCKFKMS